jgi:hypothetical protein
MLRTAPAADDEQARRRRASDYRICLNAAAQLRTAWPRPALPLIVQLSSERTLEPVRRECSFAEK